MRKKLLFYRSLIFCALVSCNFCCEDFVQIDLPNSQISSGAAFASDETAVAAANGMYKSMLESRNLIGGSFNPISYIGGLSADELVDLTGTSPYHEFYENQINVNNASILNLWSAAYRTIYEANAVITGVTSSPLLSKDVQRQLLGEAKFIRALYYFYLVNLFGDVPLVRSTDYRDNATINRTPINLIYEQINLDLVDAKDLLTEQYFTSYRTRPNKLAASAMLARTYLYQKEYAKAEGEATAVIESSLYSLQADLSKVFLANSSESILELSQVYPNSFPTADGLTFFADPFFGTTKVLSDNFLNAFDAQDLRVKSWTTSVVVNSIRYACPYKYKTVVHVKDANFPENLVLLRLAEQYLIRAEARLEQGDLTGAQDDLNLIRNRAGLSDTDANDQALLRLAIEQERKFEFFCEMGHRWLDLKRTNRADAALAPQKASWNSTGVLFPIPEQEMLNNPNLTPQNDGY